MTTYGIEASACLRPRATTFETEATGCFGLGDRDFDPGTPWTDGAWWLDFGGELVGWTDWPPIVDLGAVPLAEAA